MADPVERCANCDRAECPYPALSAANQKRWERAVFAGEAKRYQNDPDNRAADEAACAALTECLAYVNGLPAVVRTLRSQLAEVQRELERHRHGATIEGDHACAAEVWRATVGPLVEAVAVADAALSAILRDPGRDRAAEGTARAALRYRIDALLEATKGGKDDA